MTEQQLKNVILETIQKHDICMLRLAKFIDRDRKTINNWLQGKHGTSVETLVVLCDALGLEVIIREKEGAE
ncbi:MAG: helix-turn-helix transcriptional regulator [Bacteroidales bacterium]|nr:helix-turn-helix transcriptional regulator [Bacteroidales bacterium]